MEFLNVGMETGGEVQPSISVAELKAQADALIARENELAKERREIVNQRVEMEFAAAGFAVGDEVEANLKGKWVKGTITGLGSWGYNGEAYAGVWYPSGVYHKSRPCGGFWLTSIRKPRQGNSPDGFSASQPADKKENENEVKSNVL